MMTIRRFEVLSGIAKDSMVSSLRSFKMLGTTRPVTQCHIAEDLNPVQWQFFNNCRESWKMGFPEHALALPAAWIKLVSYRNCCTYWDGNIIKCWVGNEVSTVQGSDSGMWPHDNVLSVDFVHRLNFNETQCLRSPLSFHLQARKAPNLVDPSNRAIRSHWAHSVTENTV
jgi:hypothetical protein